MANKYEYYFVIQSNFGGYWEDESEYQTNSTYTANRDGFIHDLKEYRFAYQNMKGGSVRSIRRRVKI